MRFAVALSILLQLGVVFLGNTSLRQPLRFGVYGINLGMLFVVRGRLKPHPAARWALVAVALLLIGIINPDGDRLAARIACVVLYTTVLAPIIWVGRLRFGPRGFRTVLLMMWGFYTASATLGVLQVEFPGRFEAATANTYDQESLDEHMFTAADGTRLPWPKGLSDTPGGASTGGVNSIVLGVGLLLTESNLLLLATTVAGMFAGLFCIYICQERTPLISVGLCAAVVLTVVVRRGAWGRAVLLASVAVGVAVIGTGMAITFGGAGISQRFGTLIANDPGTVFHANRGQFVEELFTSDIFDMPLGAGEGRWGLVSGTFGKSVKTLWAEIMWQALLYDGGIPLMLAYAGLLGSLAWTAYRIAIEADSLRMACWAATILGYTLASIAATFVFPIFAAQPGMEVILLNACLFTASRHRDPAPNAPRATSNPSRQSVPSPRRPTTGDHRPTLTPS